VLVEVGVCVGVEVVVDVGVKLGVGDRVGLMPTMVVTGPWKFVGDVVLLEQDQTITVPKVNNPMNGARDRFIGSPPRSPG
jgi:hypothetical protein